MGVQSSVELLWFSVSSVCCSTAGGRCGPGSVTTQSQFMVGKTQQYWSCAGRLQLHHGSLKTGRAICRAGPTQSHDSLLPPHSICLFLQPSLVQPQVYWLHLIFKSSLFSIWPPLTCCLPSSLLPPPSSPSVTSDGFISFSLHSWPLSFCLLSAPSADSPTTDFYLSLVFRSL